jgi:hypothetical protein
MRPSSTSAVEVAFTLPLEPTDSGVCADACTDIPTGRASKLAASVLVQVDALMVRVQVAASRDITESVGGGARHAPGSAMMGVVSEAGAQIAAKTAG